MKRVFLLGLLACLSTVAAPLQPHEVGVYGTCFDFCDFAVWKVFWMAGKQPTAEQIATYNERLRSTREGGKKNLLLLYTFDRVKHSRPIDEYLANTDAALQALDRNMIDVLCLSEENVAWNNGLAILNTLSDHIRKTYGLPVYQWLTNPDVPHPQLHADGWIIDPYGFEHDRFRRYLTKYLVTGKPVIDCITASPFPGAVFNQSARDQVDVCREFGVPMFFFCVDGKYGSPSIWLTSTDRDIAACRDWLLGIVEELHDQPRPIQPRLTSNFSTGRAIEVCGGQDLTFSFEEPFATTSFVDDVTTRGLHGLTWDGEHERSRLAPSSSDLPRMLVQWHFTSPFGMKEVAAALEGEQTAGVQTTFAVSLNGHQWSLARSSEEVGKLSWQIHVPQPDEPPREVWVRIEAAGDGAATLSEVRLSGTTIPPDTREVALTAAADGRLSYTETFDSPRFLHLAEVSGGDTLTWSRGGIETHGVKGRGNKVAVRWKLTAPRPLKKVVVTITGQANGKNLGGRNNARLETADGTVLAEASTAGGEANASGWVQAPLALRVDELPDDATTLYLTLEMVSTSGVATKRSNLITGFEVVVE